MYVENIICDIEDLIFDVKQAGSRAYDNKREADRSLSNAENGNFPSDAYYTVSEGLVGASHALDKASDDFLSIEERLRKIIEGIQMEALSAQARGRAISEATKVQNK
jgi:hypothetical protein